MRREPRKRTLLHRRKLVLLCCAASLFVPGMASSGESDSPASRAFVAAARRYRVAQGRPGARSPGSGPSFALTLAALKMFRNQLDNLTEVKQQCRRMIS
jgi:hypothetical protein